MTPIVGQFLLAPILIKFQLATKLKKKQEISYKNWTDLTECFLNIICYS